jgi:hypothetical protein
LFDNTTNIHMNFLNLSNYGETATDDYLSKKRSAETEKEIVVLSNKATSKYN